MIAVKNSEVPLFSPATDALSGGTCRLGCSEKQEGCGLLRMLCRVERYVHEQQRDANQNQCDYDIHD